MEVAEEVGVSIICFLFFLTTALYLSFMHKGKLFYLIRIEENVINLFNFQNDWQMFAGNAFLLIFSSLCPFSGSFNLYVKHISSHFLTTYAQFLSTLAFSGLVYYCLTRLIKDLNTFYSSALFSTFKFFVNLMQLMMMIGLLISMRKENRNNIYWQQFAKFKWTIVSTLISLLVSISGFFNVSSSTDFYIIIMCSSFIFSFMDGMLFTMLESTKEDALSTLSIGKKYIFSGMDGSTTNWSPNDNISFTQAIKLHGQSDNIKFVNSVMNVKGMDMLVTYFEEVDQFPDDQTHMTDDDDSGAVAFMFFWLIFAFVCSLCYLDYKLKEQQKANLQCEMIVKCASNTSCSISYSCEKGIKCFSDILNVSDYLNDTSTTNLNMNMTCTSTESYSFGDLFKKHLPQ